MNGRLVDGILTTDYELPTTDHVFWKKHDRWNCKFCRRLCLIKRTDGPTSIALETVIVREDIKTLSINQFLTEKWSKI